MAEKENNQIIILEPCTSNVQNLLKIIEEKKQADLIRVNSAEEAQQLARQHQPCMLVASILNNSDLPDRVNLFKKLESSIKYGLIKIMVVSSLKNKQVANLISALGVTDFIEEPVPLRTMQFKANLQLKAIDTIKKQQDQKKASQEKIVFKKTEQRIDEETGAILDTQTKEMPALEIEEDTFLFKNSGVKKNGKRFVVDLEGPAPETGDWIPVEDKGDAQSSWRWVPKEKEESPEVKRGDGWVHNGEKPQFQDSAQKWQLASEKPDLSFRKEGKKVAQKIATDKSGNVVVAADSKKATENVKKSKEKAIAIAKKKIEKNDKKLSLETKSKGDTENQKIDLKKQDESKNPEQNLKQIEKDSSINLDTKTKLKKDPIKESEDITKKSEPNAPLAEATEDKAKTKNNEPHTPEKEIKEKLSPLEFLKKKKEKSSQKNSPENAKVDASDEDRKNTKLSIENPLEAKDGESPDPTPLQKNEEPEKKKTKGLNPAMAALERLKNKLGNEKIHQESSDTESREKNPIESDEPIVEEDTKGQNLLKKEEKEKPKKIETISTGDISSEKDEEKSIQKLDLLEKKKKEKKKEILKAIQEEINKPLPESLPEIEIQELQKKYASQGEAPLPPKELAKKAKLEKIKALKERLLDLDITKAEENSPSFNQHDLSQEDPENTWSNKNFLDEKQRNKIRAFDSADKEEQEEETSRDLAKASEKRTLEKNSSKDDYFYLSQSKITPEGAAWEKAETHYVYLSGEFRYHGFDHLDQLLPLWIYEGEKTPELLSKTKEWKFQKQLPFQATSLKQIPKDVRDYLLNIREQLKKDAKPAESIDGPKSGSKQKQKGEPGKSSDTPIFDSEPPQDEAPLPEQITAGSFDRPKTAKAKEKRDISGLMASLEEEAQALEQNKQVADAGETPKKTKEEEKQTETTEPPPQTASDQNATAEAPPTASSLFTDKSDRKEDGPAAVEGKQRTQGNANPYFGVFLALSNCLGPVKNRPKAIGKVLKAIEYAFKDCVASVVSPPNEQGLAGITIQSNGAPSAQTEIEINSGLALKIEVEDGGLGKTLGYLFLQPIGGRKEFSLVEEDAAKKVAKSLCAVVESEPNSKLVTNGEGERVA